MADQYNFLKSNLVYLYPSANADDGGDVNTERNIKQIAKNLTIKNFIVRKRELADGEFESLFVTKESDANVYRIHGGRAVIDGYSIDLGNKEDTEEVLITLDLTSDLIPEDYVSDYTAEFINLYNSDGTPKNPDHDYHEISVGPLKLFITTLYDATGNVQGDVLENDVRTCKGVAYGFTTEEGLKDIETPYLVISNIWMDGYTVGLPFAIEVPIDAYTYIDASGISIDGNPIGNVFNEIVEHAADLENYVDTNFIKNSVGQSEGSQYIATNLNVTSPRNSNGVYAELDIDPSESVIKVVDNRHLYPQSIVDLTADILSLGSPRIELRSRNEAGTSDIRLYRDTDEGYDVNLAQVAVNTENIILNASTDKVRDGASEVIVGKTFHVREDVTDSSSEVLTVGHNIDNEGHEVRVEGFTLLNGSTRNTGAFIVEGNSDFIGIVNIDNSLKIRDSNQDTVAQVSSSGNASFAGTLSAGNTTINGNLTVKGNLAFDTSSVRTISGNPEVTSNFKIDGTLLQYGTAQFLDSTYIGGVESPSSASLTVSIPETHTKTEDHNGYVKIHNHLNTEGLSIGTREIGSHTVNNTTITTSAEISGKSFFSDSAVFNKGIWVSSNKLDSIDNSHAFVCSGASQFGDNVRISGALLMGTASTSGLQNPKIVTSGNIYAGGYQTYNNSGDIAELFPKDKTSQEYTVGTLISKVRGKNTYAPSCYNTRRTVVGVVSDTYGFLLSGVEDKNGFQNAVPVAIAGRVYVKVIQGEVIEEGDLLGVSLVEGRACKWNGEHGTMVGKALESTIGDKDKILMLVSIQ